MPRTPRLIALLLCGCALLGGALFAPDAAAQEGRPETLERARRFRAYLAQAPYHEAAFDGLVDALADAGELGGLVDSLSAELRARPDAPDARVLLARALAREGRPAEALATLAPIDGDELALALLRARLNEELGALERAVQLLERASAGDDPALARELFERRADLSVALGERDAACAALSALAQLAPENFEARAEVAARAEELGLEQAALEHHRAALALAGEDGARAARALAALARLHDARDELGEAIDAYERAGALTGRGHWLRPEIDARLAALHARAGTLDGWLAVRRAELDQAPDDRARRESLARACAACGRAEEALELLRAGTALFPDDLALGRALIELLREERRTSELVDEFQRVLARHPQQRALAFELGRALAALERHEAADGVLVGALPQGEDGPRWCARAAELWTALGSLERALSWRERAVELAPARLDAHTALARTLRELGFGVEASRALERAADHVGANARGRLELAQAHRALGDAAQVERLTLEALALAPVDAQALELLHWADARAGRSTEAAAGLRALAARCDGPVRVAAVERLAEFASERDLVVVLLGSERTLAPDPLGALVQAALQRARGDGEAALLALEDGARRHPRDRTLRRAFADELGRAGRHAAAVVELEALLELTPAARGALALELARRHELAGDDEACERWLEQARRAAGANVELLSELAHVHLRRGHEGLARAALEDAVRQAPRNAGLQLDLARVLDLEGAAAALELAFEHGTDPERARAVTSWCERHAGLGRAATLAALRARVERRPHDLALGMFCARIEIAWGALGAALATLERLAPRHPRSAQLLVGTARALGALAREREALALLDRLEALDPAARAALAPEELVWAIAVRDDERARVLAQALEDPLDAARAFEQAGRPREALRLLELALADGTLALADAGALVDRYALDGQRHAAIALLERQCAELGEDARRLRRIAQLCEECSDREGLVRVAVRLLARTRDVDEFLSATTRATRAAWMKAECARLSTATLEDDELDRLLTVARADPRHAEPVLELIGELEASVLSAPAPERPLWARRLTANALFIMARQPQRMLAELNRARVRENRGETLTEREWLELITYRWETPARRRRYSAAERARVRVACAQHPRSAALASWSAWEHMSAGELRNALEALERLIALLEEPAGEGAEEADRRHTRATQARALEALPAAPPASVVTALSNATCWRGAPDPDGPRLVLGLDEARVLRIACLARSGRDWEARGALAELDPTELGPALLAQACVAAGEDDRARAALLELAALDRSARGICGAPGSAALDASWNRIARAALEAGRADRAAQIGQLAEECHAKIEPDSRPTKKAVTSAQSAELERALWSLREGDEGSRRALLEAGAAVLAHSFEIDAGPLAIESAVRLRRRMPEAGMPRFALALLDERGGARGWREALELHEELAQDALIGRIDLLDELRVWPGRPVQLRTGELTLGERAEEPSGKAPANWRMLCDLEEKRQGMGAGPHLLAAVRMALLLGEPERAARIVARLGGTGVSYPAFVGRALHEVLRPYSLGAGELEARRVLFGLAPAERDLKAALIESLVAHGRLEEAQEVAGRE